MLPDPYTSSSFPASAHVRFIQGDIACSAGLTPWFKEVQKSQIPELISFAKGLQRDEAAVRVGLSLKWSQGPVEGTINKLKLIKRSMLNLATVSVNTQGPARRILITALVLR
jgi:hypothetical protein